MYQAYELTSKDPNKLATEKWDIIPIQITGGTIIVFKDIKIPFDDPLVANLLKQYNSEKWQSCALDKKKAKINPKYYEGIGYCFERVYDNDTNKYVKRMILSDKAKDSLCTWRIEADYSTMQLSMTPLDLSFPYCFSNADVLDKYAPELMERLKAIKLIHKITL